MNKDNESLMLDVGQANEIKLAARRAGATNTDIKRLSEGNTFARILPILRGVGEVVIASPVVDLDADPFIPEGFTVKEHIKGGLFYFDPAKVLLYLDEAQQRYGGLIGAQLAHRLEKVPYNANLLDFYLLYPHLIPDDWQDKEVFFWGTIYSNPGNRVRSLVYKDGRWQSGLRWLGDNFSSGDFTAVSASDQ